MALERLADVCTKIKSSPSSLGRSECRTRIKAGLPGNENSKHAASVNSRLKDPESGARKDLSERSLMCHPTLIEHTYSPRPGHLVGLID